LAFGVTEAFLRPGEPTPVVCPTPIPPTPRPAQPLFTPAGPPPPPPPPTLRPGSQPAPRRVSFYSGIWMVNPADKTSIVAHENDAFGADQVQARLVINGWSPDSREILFSLTPAFSASALSDGLPLWAVPASGGQARNLGVTVISRHEDFIDELANGTPLAVVAGGFREVWTRKQIALLDVASGRVSYLTDSSTTAISPSWSLDGELLAYVSSPDVGSVGGGNEGMAAMTARRILVSSRDGSNARRLTSDEAYREERPLWSADGTQILFIRIDGEGAASLWIVSADGGQPTKITTISQVPSGIYSQDTIGPVTTATSPGMEYSTGGKRTGDGCSRRGMRGAYRCSAWPSPRQGAVCWEWPSGAKPRRMVFSVMTRGSMNCSR